NFFFGIRVKWKSGGETVLYLGQGSNGPRNNWWIGAPQIEAGDSARITLPSGQVLKIEGASPEEDLGAPFDIVDKVVPDQFRGPADIIGKSLLKDLFGQVNLFRLSTQQDKTAELLLRSAERWFQIMPGCIGTLPRQAGISKVELPATRWRYSAGVR